VASPLGTTEFNECKLNRLEVKNMSHLKVTKTSLNCGKISVLENWVKKKIIVGVIVFNIAIFFGVVQISKI